MTCTWCSKELFPENQPVFCDGFNWHIYCFKKREEYLEKMLTLSYKEYNNGY